MWWGYSQALDLLAESSSSNVNDISTNLNQTSQNILLVGQGDGRHVLKTIAKKYNHECEKVNFYIYEPLLENIARELLFLTLALEPSENIGIAEKTLFFMELYGNTLLRPATANYLIQVSKKLLNAITNFNYAQEILPSINLEKLKYKERDQLEIIFKCWASNTNKFDILTAWDERLRKSLGARYDSRSGIYDWDYHMRYHNYGADILHLQEYKRFREKGLSFYFGDTDPCIPNITLASAIFPVGSKIFHYGYLGDIITGPYATFGFDCEDKNMLKKVNGQISKTATDVTERNLMRIFYEIEQQKPFIPLPEDENACPALVIKDESDKLKIQSDSSHESEITKVRFNDCTAYKSISISDSKVIFMPTTALKYFPNKSEYESFFDTVFITQTMILNHIKPDFFKMIKNKGKVIVESPKFLLKYRKEDLENFKKELNSLMTDSKCKLDHSYNCEKDEFIRYFVEK